MCYFVCCKKQCDYYEYVPPPTPEEEIELDEFGDPVPIASRGQRRRRESRGRGVPVREPKRQLVRGRYIEIFDDEEETPA